MISLTPLTFLLILITADRCFSAGTAQPNPFAVNGFEFGSMATVLDAGSRVWHLEEDVFIPGNILYSLSTTLMTTDGKTAHVIVGSGAGYVEGKGTLAQFNGIAGFLQTNSTHVLLADLNNHCLRYTNRTDNLTSPFVGSCLTPGFKDGQYENSWFNKPWSLIRDSNNKNTVIVTDNMNNALRSVNLLTGEVSTLVKSLPSYPFGAAYDSTLENIYLTFHKLVGKFNTKSSEFSMVAPILNSRVLDGDFRNASFSSARDIVRISHNVFLVADFDSDKLNILNIDEERVHSVCPMTTESSACSLIGPSALFLKSGTLYIGDVRSIRSVTVKDLTPCRTKEIAVSMPAGDKEKCIEVVPGQAMCYPPGLHRDKLTQQNCTINITITKDDACKSNPCLNSGICIAGENNSYTCTCTAGWLGRNCQLGSGLKERLDISASYKVSCNAVKDVAMIPKMKKNWIKILSSGHCDESAAYPSQMSCTNDNLSLSWPTDCIFPHKELNRQTVAAAVQEFLQKFGGSVLTLILPNHMPPLVLPIQTKEGLPATMLFTII